MTFATWRAPPDDPHRPAKRSRMVRIAISQEAMEDYAAGSEEIRIASNERLIAWLRGRIAAFDPTKIRL
jgi:hypothetical protein